MHLWRVNALLLAGAAVLAGVIVGIGAYRQRHRHHPITRFVFLGATTLFLPILSSVVSTVRSRYSDFAINYEMEEDLELLSAVVARCHIGNQVILVLWAFFVQIIMINTSTVVSGGLDTLPWCQPHEGLNTARYFSVLGRTNCCSLCQISAKILCI
jgi:hypothetical protein